MTTIDDDLLTPHDWLQLGQAASGCISGTLAEWPDLANALCKWYGTPLKPKTPATQLQMLCRHIVDLHEGI